MVEPRKRVRHLDQEAISMVDMLMEDSGRHVDVKVYVADHVRGWYRPRWNAIIIPAWLWTTSRPFDYIVWYIAHELSHAIAEKAHPHTVCNHGPLFMDVLKQVCPKWAIHHELGYKPRLAKAAGIKEPKE